MVKISEIFYSIQGEGIHAGLPMAFVRFQFCPWDCDYCDSRYTWDRNAGTEMSVDEVVSKVQEYPTKWVCITGGEPLSQPKDFKLLVQHLYALGYKIEVETSGLNPLPIDSLNRPLIIIDSWVMDIKGPSAQLSKGSMQFRELARLTKGDQVKFVVRDQADLDFVDDTLGMHPTKAHVLVSPVMAYLNDQGVPDIGTGSSWSQEVAEFCKARGHRMSMQIHKMIWGDRKGV